MKVLVTGKPGSGKSTVVVKVLEELKGRGWKVGGTICPEVREGVLRVGFDMVDLMTGRRGRLSSTAPSNGPRVGKYFVNLGVVEAIGSVAIRNALERADLVVIDEIGPMEMKSLSFRNAVGEALDKAPNLLAVVHWTMVGDFGRANIRLLEVRPDNRDGSSLTILGLFSEN
jgi:nucleoside-triphosphatase